MKQSPHPLILLLPLLLLACHSTRIDKMPKINFGSLTQQYVDKDLEPTPWADTIYPKSYLIEYVDSLPSRSTALKMDSLCTTTIVAVNAWEEVTVPDPHAIYTKESLRRVKKETTYKNYTYLLVHPLYRGVEKGTFCYIISSGHDIESTGEEWAILYMPKLNNQGQIILGEIVESYVVWF